MKKWITVSGLFIAMFPLISGISYAYDATGKWNYSLYDAYNNCGESNTSESGTIYIIQTGSKFLIIGDDFSTEGNISGNIYTYSDKFCEEDGVVTEKVSITLASETSGQGSVTWTYAEPGFSCKGGYKLTISKNAQAAPVYDATGKWNFTQSGFITDCGSATVPRASGYFEVNQTGNRFTALDDQGDSYSGFVDGAQYFVARSYPDKGGRTTNWATITLSSKTQGSGGDHFVWDDDCDECWGNWNITITKEKVYYIITASAGPGGSIQPSGKVSVEEGGTKFFYFYPDPGYGVESILFNQEVIEARNWTSCYVYDVDADCTLKVIFRRIGDMPWLPLLLDE